MTNYAGSRSNLFINTRREQYTCNVADDLNDFSFLSRNKSKKTSQMLKESALPQTARSQTTRPQTASHAQATRPLESARVQNQAKATTQTRAQAAPRVQSNVRTQSAQRPQAAARPVAKAQSSAQNGVRGAVVRPMGKKKTYTGTTSFTENVLRAMRETSAEKPRIKVITRKIKEKRPFPVAFISYSVVFTILFMFLLLSFSRINEYTIDINDLKNEVTKQQTEQSKLKLQVDSRDDLRYIEQVASEKLGMVKSDKLTKMYVSIGGEDKLEVKDVKKDSMNVGVVMSGVAELFEAFLGN